MNEGEKIEFNMDGLRHTAVIESISRFRNQISLQIRIINSE